VDLSPAHQHQRVSPQVTPSTPLSGTQHRSRTVALERNHNAQNTTLYPTALASQHPAVRARSFADDDGCGQDTASRYLEQRRREPTDTVADLVFEIVDLTSHMPASSQEFGRDLG